MNQTIVKLEKSNRKGKKFKATIRSPGIYKTVHFGSSDYEDYTTHKDIFRKNNYIARHSKILKKDGTRAIDDIFSPSWFSMWLLWNKPTLKESIKALEENGIKFIF